ncbi:Tll0287-like domain-containing protein [Elongatibacter sediminis]|uniref:DUF3365 domain-containing protein n=1 Tax=Elongatibacter sediminis TaxID=3119006 RepID=A0AAW9RIT6_9GAMM
MPGSPRHSAPNPSALPARTDALRRFGGSSRYRIIGSALLLAAGLLMLTAAHAGDDPRKALSKNYALRLQSELGARLKAAMTTGGPVAAIDVCQVEAPVIAAKMLTENGPTKIGRTALRVRNPMNAPDEEARVVLENFRQAMAAGETPAAHFTVREDGSARYMQAIGTQPLCLACHGTELAPEVREALARHYPEDQATGFSVGELRGSFLIEWPATAATP